ncbi:hypothetical protein Tco_1028390 [Tanacetum coccineum]|uniref:Uncharacterized protein n=1 Tax=Tanacetum coccineum TaxID=301880 RepID=A0ABQ5G0V0_9ASTR
MVKDRKEQSSFGPTKDAEESYISHLTVLEYYSYNEKTGIYNCQIDEQWFTLNANLLRKVLEITHVDTTNPFEPPPAREAVMDFVNELRYPEPIHFVSKIRVNYLYQPWRAILSLINQCLTDKTFGSDKPKHLVLQMLCGSKHNIHRRQESAIHDTGDDFLLGNLKFVPKGEKDEVFGMTIPKHLITEAIQQSLYYQQYLNMVSKQPKANKGVKKKTASEIEKPKKPAPVKKMKLVKEKPYKPSSSKKPVKGRVVKKVRKGKSNLKLVDEEEEIQQEPEPQGESEDSDVKHAIKLSLDSFQTPGEGEGKGEDYDYERAIKMSLDSFQTQIQAPVGGVAIRERVAEEIRKLPDVEGKGKAIATDEQEAHSLLDLHKSKNKSATDKFILQRRNPIIDDTTTGPSSQPQDDTSEKVAQETSSPSDSTSVAAKDTDSE